MSDRLFARPQLLVCVVGTVLLLAVALGAYLLGAPVWACWLIGLGNIIGYFEGRVSRRLEEFEKQEQR